MANNSEPKYFANLRAPELSAAMCVVVRTHRSPGIKMLKFTTASGIVVGIAVLGISAAAVFASASPPEPELASALHRPLAKAGPSWCAPKAKSARHGWPYYDQGCRFDLRTPDQEAPTVRLIALR